MNEEIVGVLKNLGLEEKEIKIYLSLLESGESGVTAISDNTRIERTLCYSIIQKLIDKGLLSYVIKNNVKYFKSAHPEKLLSDLKDREKELNNVMGELVSLTNLQKEETKVEIYRGKEGLKAVLKDIIREGKDYLAFGEEGRFQEALPIYIHQFLLQVVKNKMHEKVLVREDLRGKVVKVKNSEFRYLPKHFLSPVTTAVYGNKVASLIWKGLYAILIENKEIADSFRSQFNALWKIAKR